MPAAPTTLRPLRDRIEAAVAEHRHQECVVLPDATLTYGEIDRLANATANVLLERGVREGGVVMTLCHNGAALVGTWFACLKIGAVFAPLNASLTGSPLAHVMSRARGQVLVCDAPLAGTARAASRDLATLTVTLVAGALPSSGLVSLDQAVAAASTAPPPLPDANPAAPARLMFTSGTTGESKGVLWSRNAEVLHAVCYGDELVRTAAGETVYCCLPLFHVTAQGTLLGTLLRGGRAVVDRRFEPLRFWARTRAVDAVFFPYVGTIISTLTSRAPRREDAENPVRRAMGSATPAGLWQAFERRFGVALEDVWGQTETASCWTRAGPDGPVPGTVGAPCDRFEARIVNAAGSETALHEAGELWIRPAEPHVIFEGYADAPEGAHALSHDGWYRTGDLLARRAGGALSFHGRLRDAIRRRGETIAPAEIEAVAVQHPAIREAAAIGVPADDGVEDEILLCVVLHDPTVLSPSDLHAHLMGELPKFMVPRFIRIEAELPKTATTRVRRAALREAGHAGAWDARARRGHHG
ncbi:MAG TPA: AMP-binding protein [Candidatus Saccharimonadales bacterium]|nr:AMP-binding protein [Candidatus Saccharimonadales bacterium]